MSLRYVDIRLAALTETSTKRCAADPAALRQGSGIGEGVVRPFVRFKFAKDATHKPCSKCRETKPLDAFNILKTGALGRTPSCRACINLRGLAYTKRTRELRSTRQRPDRCEVCQSLPGKRALNWDHDHTTGKFRGWLCAHCNSALGHVMDSTARLWQLIGYLERQSLSPGDDAVEKLRA